jgi:hypothetical protein
LNLELLIDLFTPFDNLHLKGRNQPKSSILPITSTQDDFRTTFFILPITSAQKYVVLCFIPHITLW